MCDQDHFDEDRQEWESRGLVTRRQFGVLLGAGVTMLLPQVANAVAVTESDVSVMTPDASSKRTLNDASCVAPAVLAGTARDTCREVSSCPRTDTVELDKFTVCGTPPAEVAVAVNAAGPCP